MGESRFTETPTLFLNRSAEDREACRFLMKAGVPCEFVAGPAEAIAPMLLFGLEEFVGLAEIRRFVESWLKGQGSSQAPGPDA